jgi:hypothetical protein
MRLACIYAVLDLSELIRLPHLQAGLACWQFAEDSARYIFGDSLGDPVADELAQALKAAGAEGMSRSQIRDYFQRHRTAGEIDRAVAALKARNLIVKRMEQTPGRPTERWFWSATKATKATEV